jgi:hypothetical protein
MKSNFRKLKRKLKGERILNRHEQMNFKALLTPESFAVERPNGSAVFVEATNFWVTREGRLVFTRALGLVRVAAYAAGAWVRVQRGLTAQDLGHEKRGMGEQR